MRGPRRRSTFDPGLNSKPIIPMTPPMPLTIPITIPLPLAISTPLTISKTIKIAVSIPRTITATVPVCPITILGQPLSCCSPVAQIAAELPDVLGT